MIASIQGTILECGERFVVIDSAGLGYKVYVTDDTLHTLTVGDTISLRTHLVVREDALDLYGFTHPSEKRLFELLISVSGIGPKSALNILSLVTRETLIHAIQSGTTAHLTKVSGIGKKTAEKIILELKDKISAFSDTGDARGMSTDIDAIEALRALGYDATEAREALKAISKDITDTGAKIKAALKMLN